MNIAEPIVALPPAPRRALRFLPSEATIAERITAAARNHQRWFSAMTQAGGGEVRRENGVLYTGPNGGDIAFPQMMAQTAGATLDRILAYYRHYRPADGTGRSVGVWAVTPTRPRDLGSRLMARGFEWGWRPHWMGLNLHEIRADFPLPENLHIAVDDAADWDVEELPYFSPEDAAKFRKVAAVRPRRIWHFGAWLNGVVVGHSILYLTTGRYGVAGIYNVGVIPSARNQGVGRAITLAACEYARALGANHALLNSATHIYDRLGFVSLGHGQSWWMYDRMFAAAPPTPERIAFVEALGRGDTRTLEALPPSAIPADVNAPLLCGHTPMEIAANMQKSASARWLIGRGATVALLERWDMGWKTEVAQMLAQNPTLVNDLSVGGVRTPVHEAASRGDIELLTLLLTANPDCTICDTEFKGTALGWARHFGQDAAARLLEGAG